MTTISQIKRMRYVDDMSVQLMPVNDLRTIS